VSGLTAPVDELGAAARTIVSSDGLTLRVDTIARDLTDPVDLAATPDGRLFIAERGGRIVVADASTAALVSGDNLFERLLRESQPALTSLALASDFASSGIVHLTYSSQERRGTVVRLARVRERAGRFGEAAVLASEPVASDASALVRTAPDGSLYVGISTGADPGSAQRLAAASGKILRLRHDGSLPDDNPWHSSVFSVGHNHPRGLAWHPGTGALWEMDAGDGGGELNVVRAGANYGWPVATGAARHPRVTSPALLLPAGTDASGLTTVGVPGTPFSGDLIVSALGAEDLLRVRIAEGGTMQIAGLLLQRRFGRIRQVASGPDGALFAITGNQDTWGAGRDIAIRIVPAAASNSPLLQLSTERR
jgi:glucose/arabinose dehydrogenase